MQTETTTAPHQSLADTLESTLASHHKDGPAIGELANAVGEKGFGLLLIILSLPSALPVPAPGYSNPGLAEKMIGAASKFLRMIEHLIRPRHHWIRSRAGQSGLAAIIIIMACLMMLPIPLTNTFPAMVIFMIGIGLSEEDGLLAIAAFVIGVAAVTLYCYIIFLVITQGPEAAEGIKDWVKSLLSNRGDAA